MTDNTELQRVMRLRRLGSSIEQVVDRLKLIATRGLHVDR